MIHHSAFDTLALMPEEVRERLEPILVRKIRSLAMAVGLSIVCLFLAIVHSIHLVKALQAGEPTLLDGWTGVLPPLSSMPQLLSLSVLMLVPLWATAIAKHLRTWIVQERERALLVWGTFPEERREDVVALLLNRRPGYMLDEAAARRTCCTMAATPDEGGTLRLETVPSVGRVIM